MSKLYLISSLLLISLICQFAFLGNCLANTPSNELQKIVDTVSGKEETDVKKEERIDPAQNYKLVAIYFINKEPRALIKSVTNPEAGTVEFKVGDFLDEFQTVSISKISFNPTVRVELIDDEGINYFLKPHAVNDKNISTPSKSTYSKSLPSHFSGKTEKTKPKKSALSPPSSPVDQADTAPKKDENVQAGGEAQESSTPASTSLKPASTQSTQTGESADSAKPKAAPAKAPGTLKPDDSGLDRDRPSNPFGE